MKDTLEYIIKALVESPDDVNIEEHEEDDMTVFTITVAKDEIGKIIGKEGKVIRSIRNIMKIKAMKEHKRINIALAEVQ